MIGFELIRSERRSLSIEITGDGTVLVRAPLHLPERRIQGFVKEKEEWIKRKIHLVLSRPKPLTVSKKQLEQLRKKGIELILPRVLFWSKKTGLSYNQARITSARSRLGSCSGKNNLCFSLYLADFPLHLVDYVIVHELCHTVEHNHSLAFYRLVERHLPDWKKRREEIKSIPIPILSEE